MKFYNFHNITNHITPILSILFNYKEYYHFPMTPIFSKNKTLKKYSTTLLQQYKTQ